MSDSLGLLVFTPFLLAVFRGELVSCFASKTWLRRAESLGLLLATCGVAYGVFFVATRPVLFVLFPPLMLVTFRLGRIGIKTAVMLVAVIGCIATIYGHGPIVKITADPADQSFVLQGFLAILSLTCLPVAGEVTARNRLADRLAAHDREMTTRAMYDPLTGLLNRAGFEERADALLPARMQAPVSVIAIDFDYFKTINDRWGHQAGNRALQHVAGVFRAATRAGDLVARLGGDEFVILLPGSNISDAVATGQRIRDRLQATPLHVDDGTVTLIGLSMGAAAAAHGERYSDLLRRADAALYAAKAAGRNTLRMAG